MAGVTRKVFTREGRYIVKTPTVTAAIRGTSFCLKVEDLQSAYFCVCNGTINLKGSHEDHGDNVSAKHHAARRYRVLDGETQIDEAGMLYHGDKDLEELAKIINEKIDWSKLY
jgi:hypothetical protein